MAQSNASNPSADLSSTTFPVGEFLPAGHPHYTLPSPAPQTHGFKLNHLMIRIRDPKQSLRFYCELMGMRVAFTMNTGPFTIYYLAYPQTEGDRKDLKAFGEKVCGGGRLQQTEGLLELYHVHGSEKQPPSYYSTGSTPPNLGFGHLGFTVPDVPKALKYLRENGVKVIKPLEVAEKPDIPLSQWEVERDVGLGELHPNYQQVFKQIAFVVDPDGYTVELVPQGMDATDP